MSQAIVDKSAKVIIVESSSTNRQMLINLWKEHGYSSISGTGNLKDAIQILEVEEIDWIITPLFSDAAENGLNLLEACTKYEALSRLQVSLLLEKSEIDILPEAFAKGLFSWHEAPYTKESMTQELNTLMDYVSHYGEQCSLATAHYLRNYLKTSDMPRELLQFEKRLIQNFPTVTGDLLMHIAEASFISGDNASAETYLRQLECLAPDKKSNANDLRRVYGSTDSDTPTTDEKLNLLGISSCLVVDNDETVQRSIQEILTELGVPQVEIFNDGESAVGWIKDNKNVELVIQEWRIPKLTGPYFLQRAMSEGALTTPFIVYSSLIKDADIPFVKEMGIANVIHKPMVREKIMEKLFWTVQQDRMPNETGSLERKIRSLLRAKNLDAAKPLIRKIVKNPKIPFGKKLQVRAEMEFVKGNYQKTKELCIEAIKQSGDSLLSLSLLGKTLMMLRDFPAALKCMKKAQDLSPHNIERLCTIAEAHSELGEDEQARETLSEAKAMDEDNKQVQASELDLAIAGGKEERARKLLGSLDSLREFISYTNNKAVACARCGFYEEGMDHYRKVLAVLDDTHGDFKSIITYNLAMAYARAGDFDSAKKEASNVSLFTKNARLNAKAQSLLKKIENAIENGDDTLFSDESSTAQSPNENTEQDRQNSTDPNSAEPSSDAITANKSEVEADSSVDDDFLTGVLHEPGQRGCFLLYNDTGKQSPLSMKLQAQSIRFLPRSAIERSETGGADKLFSTGS